MPDESSQVIHILGRLQHEVDKISTKQDAHVSVLAELKTRSVIMYADLSSVAGILVKGNGKPSLVSQVESLSRTVDETQKDLTTIQMAIIRIDKEIKSINDKLGIKTPKEVTVERVKASGMVAAAVIGVIPGILAFIHNFL